MIVSYNRKLSHFYHKGPIKLTSSRADRKERNRSDECGVHRTKQAEDLSARAAKLAETPNAPQCANEWERLHEVGCSKARQ